MWLLFYQIRWISEWISLTLHVALWKPNENPESFFTHFGFRNPRQLKSSNLGRRKPKIAGFQYYLWISKTKSKVSDTFNTSQSVYAFKLLLFYNVGFQYVYSIVNMVFVQKCGRNMPKQESPSKKDKKEKTTDHWSFLRELLAQENHPLLSGTTLVEGPHAWAAMNGWTSLLPCLRV